MKKNIYFYETNTPIGKIGIATTEDDSHITDLTWESDFENLKKGTLNLVSRRATSEFT